VVHEADHTRAAHKIAQGNRHKISDYFGNPDVGIQEDSTLAVFIERLGKIRRASGKSSLRTDRVSSVRVSVGLHA